MIAGSLQISCNEMRRVIQKSERCSHFNNTHGMVVDYVKYKDPTLSLARIANSTNQSDKN